MSERSASSRTVRLCLIGMMAAVACVSNYISIPFFASRFHVGNAVCVLCGLLLGPVAGFFAAGVGNGLFDIVGGYGLEFIITFINKGAIALVTGLIAYKTASKSKLVRSDYVHIVLGSVLGALTYTALYLIKSFIQLRFVRGLSFEDTISVDGVTISGIWTTMATKGIASLTNAIFAFVVAPILFSALHPALRHLGLYEKG